MNDSSKTNKDLIEELSSLKQRIKELERSKTNLEWSKKALQQQHELVMALGRTTDLQENMAVCLSSALIVTEMDCGGIYLVDEVSKGFHLAQQVGLSEAFVLIAKTIEPESPHARLIHAGQPVYIKHSDLTADGQKLHEGLRALAVIPVCHQGQAIACLNIASHTMDETPQEIRPFIESLAMQMGSFLSRTIMMEALRNSEERFRELAETLPETVFETDLQGMVTFANRNAFDCFGYTQQDFAGGLNALDFIATCDIERAQANIQRNMNGENIGLNEYTLRRKDGSTFPSIINSSVIVRDGKPFGLRGFVIDITERKLAEGVLRQRESYLSAIIENQPGLVWLKDTDSRFLAVNRAFAISCGKQKAEELAGKTDLDIWPKELAEKYRRDDLEIMDTKKPAVVEEPIYDQGKTRWFETFKTPVLDGQGMVIGTTGYARDISERKRAEEHLRHMNTFLDSIVENIPNMIFLKDAKELRFVSFNRAGEDLLGNSREDLLGKNDYDLFPKEQADFFTQKDREALGSEEVVVIPEESICTRYKGERILHTKKVPILDAKGEPEYLLGISEDITERKMLEAQLMNSQKMEAIGTLAGGIAHDFNNLLMGIQGYASLILLDIDPSDPHYEKLKRIEEQVQSGAVLTRQLLGFARGGRYEVKPVNMNEVIKKTSAMFGRTRKEITIHRKYEKNVWVIEADQGQIEQVLLNLYLNAWHAMPAGGDLSIETKNIVVGKDYANSYSMIPGRYLQISISDTGVGMDEKTKERIFEPFFTTKELGRGTGLGLAMVYGITKNHNGFIDVTSKPGHGTAFVLYFPASEKGVAKEKPTVPESIKGTETILLIDDEPDVLAVSKAILESLGYSVYAFKNGEEATELYKQKMDEIGLVVLDMIMPGLSGSETFDRIMELNTSAKIILSSGYSLNDQAQQIMNKGCLGFIQKPFDIVQLSRKVREVLD
jgi:PAS domain S-box-containing protein